MTRTARPRTTPLALASAAAMAALASFALTTAAAADYDMDCKLLLCIPAGFPAGCSDAFDHMIDRLRDGKSPIGFCSLSGGGSFEGYDIDYRFASPTSPSGWKCPDGKSLYHRRASDDDDDGYWTDTVHAFCYDAVHTQRRYTNDGFETSTVYTGQTRPERADFWVNLTVEPDTPAAFSRGWQGFNTGRGSRVRVVYSE